MNKPVKTVTAEVVVPSFGRPVALASCLEALLHQTRIPEGVLVALRSTDSASRAVVARYRCRFPRLTVVDVSEPGVIAAMTAAVKASTADVIAFTDDDAMPRPNWLSQILTHFRSADLGGVGGRDVIAGQESPRSFEVGVFRRSGKLVGNHHLGSGPPREVDVLKGVNMAFRFEALALPREGALRGAGAQVHFEILVCGWARQHGWRLLYDPDVIVDHVPGERAGPDRRGRPLGSAVLDASYNFAVSTSLVHRARVARFTAHSLLVGSRAEPGLARTLAALVRREGEVLRRVPAALAGKAVGTWDAARVPTLNAVMVTASDLRPDHHGNRSPYENRPTVALVAHAIHHHGGMEKACAELIRELHRDVRFFIVATELAPDLVPLVERWVRLRAVSKPFPVRFLWFSVAGAFAVRRLNVDLVHTVGAIIPNRVDLAAIHFCHAGALAACRSFSDKDFPVTRRANSALARNLAILAERWAYRPSRLAHLAPVSKGVAAEVSRHYPGIPISVIPNGVDIERFRPDATVRDSVRAAHRILDGDIVAVFVGGDWRRKGLAIAIEALGRLPAAKSRFHLWVLGAGNEAWFRVVARREGVDDRVTFFGTRRDVERFCQAADFFVLPSLYETFSLAAYEAAACGLPVVAPAVSGVGDLISDGKAGLLVYPDADDVAQAMQKLADSRLRAEMGKVGRERASRYSWQSTAELTYCVYEELCNVKNG